MIWIFCLHRNKGWVIYQCADAYAEILIHLVFHVFWMCTAVMQHKLVFYMLLKFFTLMDAYLLQVERLRCIRYSVGM
jgi:hypothetical protein